VSRSVTTMTIHDVEHYTEEERERIIASYPEDVREARAFGIPVLGEGRVFPIARERIAVPAFAIPAHWAQIVGLDFGWDHPTAAVRLAHDRDEDCVYVVGSYRRSKEVPLIHAAAIKPWGDWLPIAWPADGLQTGKGDGVALKEHYEHEGLSLLPEHATHESGGTSVEAGVIAILERMQTGRFKVFDHLADWFEEFNLYHRKDGKIVDKLDDLLSATRYAHMMLRYAITKPAQRTRRPTRVGMVY
jgi:Terminase RNaseH-like domain/Terminase large subunit, T4likevirus-type, N-terminal